VPAGMVRASGGVNVGGVVVYVTADKDPRRTGERVGQGVVTQLRRVGAL